MIDTTVFFQVGGTLAPDSPSYIERPADDKLITALESNELCLVLAPRQSGKSSLMVRAYWKLKNKGVSSAIVDLQALKHQSDPERWFYAVINQIVRSVNLETNLLTDFDLNKWWKENTDQEPNHRFMNFLADILLSKLKEVVIFIDEIDAVLSLPFSDEFFTIIRELYNTRRPSEPHLKGLNFVLLGVASASSFMKDKNASFNIGCSIALDDFSQESIAPFKKVLGNDSDELIQQIFYWTNGQPYLVQKLALIVNSLEKINRKPKGIEEVVDKAFFQIKIQDDIHLNTIQNYLLGHPENLQNPLIQQSLIIYWQIFEGKHLIYNEESSVHNLLKLSGIVRINGGKRFEPRNRIYKTVFDKNWVLSRIDPEKYYLHLEEKNKSVKRNLLIFCLILSLLLIGSVCYGIWIHNRSYDDIYDEKLAEIVANKDLLENDVDRLKTAKEKLEADLKKTIISDALNAAKVDELEKTREKLEADLKTAKASDTSYVAKIGELEKAKEKLEADLKIAQEGFKTAKTSDALNVAKVGELEKAKEKLEADLKTAKASDASNAAKVAELEKAKEKLEADLKISQEDLPEIEDLEKVNAKLEGDLKIVRDALKIAEEELKKQQKPQIRIKEVVLADTENKLLLPSISLNTSMKLRITGTETMKDVKIKCNALFGNIDNRNMVYSPKEKGTDSITCRAINEKNETIDTYTVFIEIK